jgi:hypothetical protein
MDEFAAPGSGSSWSRNDHVHLDTSPGAALAGYLR